MLFVSCKMYQVSVELKCRHFIVYGFYCFGCSVFYCQPDLFQKSLNIFWKGNYVIVNSDKRIFHLFNFCRIFYSRSLF